MEVGIKFYPDLIFESDLLIRFLVIIISAIKKPLIKAQQQKWSGRSSLAEWPG